jgi:PKD repeat protein
VAITYASLATLFAGGVVLDGAMAAVTVVTGAEDRPDTSGVVMWIGSVDQPSNMQTGDLWFSADPDYTPPAATAPTITTTTLLSMADDVVFSQTLAATGSNPKTWVVTVGSLPAGLVLSTAGVLSGTPTTPGAYSFTVTATNTAGSDTQAYTGTVAASATAPTVTTTTLTTLTDNSVFSQTLVATGSTPITWAVTTGTLPAGISLSTSGLLSGTPTTPGAYSFTVTATNVAGNDTQAYSGTVEEEAAPPGATLSVFAGATPGTGDTINTDGGGSLWYGNRFYRGISAPALTIVGMRIWNPTESDGTFLNLDVTAKVFFQDFDNAGGDQMASPITWSDTPVATKTHTALRVAGTWTDILFDTPFAAPHYQDAAYTGNDTLFLGVQFSGGNYYVVVTGLDTGAIDSADGIDVLYEVT